MPVGVIPALAEGIHTDEHRKKGLRAKSNRPSVPFKDHLRNGTAVLPVIPATDTANVLAALNNITFGMDGNDVAGNCVAAASNHGLQTINQILTGVANTWTMDQIWAFYKTQNPDFDPEGASTDNGPGSAADGGMDIQLALETLVKMGLILGFAEVDPTDEDEFDAAIYLGIAVWCGVNLQVAQMDQFDDGDLDWAVVKGSKDDGGHGVPYVYYGTDKKLITWGELYGSTEGFVKKRMTQCFFVLTQAHLDNPTFRAGYDVDSFISAVEKLTGKVFPINLPPAPPVVATTLTANIQSDVSQHVISASNKAGLTPDAWLDHELRVHFKIS